VGGAMPPGLPDQSNHQVPIEVAAEFNLEETFFPNTVTAATITTAINDTSRPYSTALAPDSSLQKFLIRSILFSPYFYGNWFLHVVLGFSCFTSSYSFATENQIRLFWLITPL
jgi:hypothetical protein